MAEDEESLAQSVVDVPGGDLAGTMAGSIRVQVMSLSGRCVASAILAPSATIRQIKHSIEKTQGTPVNEQRLLLEGREDVLQDFKTLEECHVSNGSNLILVRAIYSCIAFVPELSAAGCKFTNANATLNGDFKSSGNPANYARGPLFPDSGKHAFSIRIDGGCNHGGSNDAYVGVASVSKSKCLGGMDKYNLKGAWLWQLEYSRASRFSADGAEAGVFSGSLPRKGDIITVETSIDELCVDFKLNGQHVQTLYGITDRDLQPVVLAFYSRTALTLLE